MQTKSLLLLTFFSLGLITSNKSSAQSSVPDPYSDGPSNGHFYYENRGQIVDDSGNQHSEIRYYTTHKGPSVYLANDKISFVTRRPSADTLIADSTFRIDMQPWCLNAEIGQTCGDIHAFEQSQDVLNFYLPQDTNGIEDVPGYARVVYQNTFNATDMHFYSDDFGIKTFFVFRPGSDTSEFKLKFSGQDSIAVVANALEMYSGSTGVIFPEAKAYQVDATGTIIPVTWQPVWKHVGGDIVTMGFGPYSPGMDLVVSIGRSTAKMTGGATDNLVWTTFYGGNGEDENIVGKFPSDGMPVIKSNANGSLIVHALTTNSDPFPLKAGKQGHLTQQKLGGSFDCVLSAFDGNGVRQWATYFGGSDYEEATALTFLPADLTLGNLLLAGRTRSSTLPPNVLGLGTPVWRKSANMPNTGGLTGSFLASFGASNGHYFYSTFFGAGNYCYINDLCYDNAKDEIAFCGYIECPGANWSNIVETSSNAPTANQLSLRNASGRYYQNSDASTKSGFVGAFKFSDRSLTWCTLVGGNDKDYLSKIVFDASHNGLYVLGNTISSVPTGATFGTTALTSLPSSGSLPLVQPSSGSPYFQPTIKSQGQHGLILHFNQNRAIDWGTYFGASGNEEYTGLALNSSGEIYITGVTDGGDPSQSGTNAPNTAHLVPVYKQAGSSAYLQGPGNTGITSGNTNIDALIARFDASHELKWCTYFGQRGQEFNPTRVAVDAFGNVFVSGGNMVSNTSATAPPQSVPTVSVNFRYDQPSNASLPISATSNSSDELEDGWIAQFDQNNALKWSTSFGGVFPGTHSVPSAPSDARERISCIDVSSDNGKTSLFMTGITRNPQTPMYFNNGTPRCIICPSPTTIAPSYRQAYSNKWDAFIGKFEDALTTTVSSLSYSNDQSIIVSPNPSHDHFNVLFNNSTNTVHSVPVVVTNALGAVIMSRELKVTHGENNFIVDLEGLPTGMYILQINHGGQVAAAKLTKY